MKQIARSYELLGEQLFATFLTYAQIDIWRKLLYYLSSILYIQGQDLHGTLQYMASTRGDEFLTISYTAAQVYSPSSRYADRLP